jgi:hypothetical protein
MMNKKIIALKQEPSIHTFDDFQLVQQPSTLADRAAIFYTQEVQSNLQTYSQIGQAQTITTDHIQSINNTVIELESILENLNNQTSLSRIEFDLKSQIVGSLPVFKNLLAEATLELTTNDNDNKQQLTESRINLNMAINQLNTTSNSESIATITKQIQHGNYSHSLQLINKIIPQMQPSNFKNVLTTLRNEVSTRQQALNNLAEISTENPSNIQSKVPILNQSKQIVLELRGLKKVNDLVREGIKSKPQNEKILTLLSESNQIDAKILTSLNKATQLEAVIESLVLSSHEPSISADTYKELDQLDAITTTFIKQTSKLIDKIIQDEATQQENNATLIMKRLREAAAHLKMIISSINHPPLLEDLATV